MPTTARTIARVATSRPDHGGAPPHATDLKSPAATVPAVLPRFLQDQRTGSGLGDVREEASEPASSARSLPRYLQAGLAVGQPGDAWEREADAVAAQVTRMAAPAAQREGDALSNVRTSAAGGATYSLGSGQTLDRATRAYFEPRFGRDFSAVRVHAGTTAAQSAQTVNARAYTVGSDIVFGVGQFEPHTTAGRQLLAHELAHVVQQTGHGRSNGPVGGLSAAGHMVQKEDAAPSADTAASRPDPYKVVPAAAGTTGVASAQPAFIFNSKGDFVAMVDRGTVLKVTGIPNADDLAAVQKGQFWAKPGDTQPGLYDLYYEVEYFGKMSGMATDVPIKGYVYSSWLALNGTPAAPSQATQNNNWMSAIPERGQTGNRDEIIKAATAIKAEREGIEARAFSAVKKDGPTKPRDGLQSKEDARTKAYAAWLDAPDTRPSLATSTSDIRWLAFKGVFAGEGNPSTIMTYDNTNITWGVGFSGAGRPGVGATEQMMARLFNQSAASRDALWRAGITVDGTQLIAVRIDNAATGKAVKLRGTQAENFVREQESLLSLMTNVTLGLHTAGQQDPDAVVRQQNLDAQFETFLNNTLAGSAGIIDGMSNDPKAAAVAAHSVHSGQHGWGQYRSVTSLAGVQSAIDNRIAAMKKQNADAKAVGKKLKFSFIVPRSQIEANIK